MKETLTDWYYDFLYHPLKLYKLGDWKREIKWAWQRAFRGYDDTAYWGLYHYIAKIAMPVLKEYRFNGHGVPGMVCEKDEPMEKSIERWNGILDKMIYAFDVIIKDENFIEPVEVQERVDEGLKLFAKYFQTLWD